MPRYFFHFENGARCEADGGGRDYPSDGAARQEALLTARDVISGIRLGLQRYSGWTLVVQKEDGAVLCRVQLPDIVGNGDGAPASSVKR
jgi:hypothetical protein